MIDNAPFNFCLYNWKVKESECIYSYLVFYFKAIYY